MKDWSDKKILQQAKTVFDIEQRGLSELRKRLGNDFVQAATTMLGCKGHVVTIGMGKSGHVSNKIAATLASTGTPAFSIHPGEAGHGDLGMITGSDLVLAISNSGETEEVLAILPVIKRLGVKLLSMSGKVGSTLAKNSDIHLDVSVDEEACPLGLAPTASTTACLVMGDALAVTLLQMRGFTKEDFARSHPLGTLGKRLLLQIKDVMRSGDAVPQVEVTADLSEALLEMNKKGLGMTTLVDSGRVVGVFTDGDLRRALQRSLDFTQVKVKAVATLNPVTISVDKMAVEAAQIMEQKKIHSLPVCDADEQLVGALNIHDLLKSGVV